MTQPGSGKKKILIVEDDPIIGRVCIRILAAYDYAIDLAENGRVAKSMVENTHYDICLTDIWTPEMNGMELYQYLKESAPQLAEKTVFMTGDGMSRVIKSFLEESQTKCILKPFTPIELNTAIGELAN